jgi:hypothetical protein
MEAFRRLEAMGFLVLFGKHGEQYELTEKGKARVSLLIGHPCVVLLSRVPDLVDALEAWLIQHEHDHENDDRYLVSAARTLTELWLMRMGDWLTDGAK